MTPHEWDVLAVVLSAAALVACVRLGWVWGRARLRADLVPDLERRLDAAYDEGWDDAEAELAPLPPHDPIVTEIIRRHVADIDETHDFLHPDWEQLSPEHIQDPPDPVQLTPRRAGEYNVAGMWWEESPLPAVLGLGQEFSGDDRTFARWQVRRWEFRRQCGLPALEAA